MVEIKIGNCGCLLSSIEDNKYAKLCWNEKAIYLGSELNEDIIVKVLNHEYLHVIIAKVDGDFADKRFDRLFEVEWSVGKEMEKCRMDETILCEESGVPRFV